MHVGLGRNLRTLLTRAERSTQLLTTLCPATAQSSGNFMLCICPLAKKDINREQFQKTMIGSSARYGPIFKIFLSNCRKKGRTLYNYNSSKLQSHGNMFGYLLFHKILILKSLIMFGTNIAKIENFEIFRNFSKSQKSRTMGNFFKNVFFSKILLGE